MSSASTEVLAMILHYVLYAQGFLFLFFFLLVSNFVCVWVHEEDILKVYFIRLSENYWICFNLLHHSN